MRGRGIALKELGARLIWQVEFLRSWKNDCSSLTDAQGLMFLCPKCFLANKGPVGTHSVICWFAGRVSDDMDPGPGRWTPSPESTGIDDLTFVPGTPARSVSVLLTGGCGWHGFIVNGEATLS